MRAIWDFLDHTEVLKAVTRDLFQAADKPILLDGPPGCGKSWLAKAIGAGWEAEGGFAVYLEGHSGTATRPYAPFGTEPLDLSSFWRHADQAVDAVATTIDLGAGTGGLIRRLAGAAWHARGRRDRQRERALRDFEYEYLKDLQRVADGRPVLMIADNLHWWDSDSLEFLQFMIAGQLDRTFEVMRDLRVLGVRTDRRFQEPIYPDYLEGEVYPLFQASHTLQGPERASIGRLLSMLGVTRDFHEGELTTLANACGSNLALVAKLADHLKQNPAYRIGDGAAAESEVMREILEARLIQAKRSGKRIVDTLEYASILGSPFRYADLACVSGQDRSDVLDQLRQAADLEFVELMDERAAFVHDAFVAHFRERLSDRRARSYKRLAECFARSHPDEYLTRYSALCEAGEPRAAAPLLLAGLIKEIRKGKDIAEFLTPARRDALQRADLLPVLEAIERAFELFKQNEFEKIPDVLRGLPRPLPRLVQAEVDYQTAYALIATRSAANRQRAIEVLRRSKGYETDEPEVGIRLMRLLMFATVMERDTQAAKGLHEELEAFLQTHPVSSRFARDHIEVFNYMAEGIYGPETALRRTEQAMRYFGPQGADGRPYRPIEYFRARNNRGGAYMALGRYAEAVADFEGCERVMADYPDLLFLNAEWPRSNRVAAEYRLGTIDAATARERQREIIDALGATRDIYYIANNLAVYHALAGDLDAAARLLEQQWLLLEPTRDAESFISYLLRSHLIVVDYLRGELDDPQSRWDELAPLAGEIPYQTRDMYKERHRLLRARFDRVPRGDPAAWDRGPQETADGVDDPRWHDIAWGFRLPNVQYWRV